MTYPFVRELAVDGVPVTVTCRVLNLARQPYYRWLANPVTDADWVQAHRAKALFDAHRDDPEFGYRFLADEAREEGQAMADRTAWRICSTPTRHGRLDGPGRLRRRQRRHGVAQQRLIFDELIATAMKDGDDPAIVAQAVVAAATDRKPKLRYTAGPKAGRLSMLRRIVPARVFDKQIHKFNRLAS